MYLTRNFSLEEFIKSATAVRKGIDNSPDINAIDNIKHLAFILQQIRDAYNKPIIISSGYRCESLNKLVGGAKNSDHRFGAAVDIHSLEDTYEANKELWDLIVKMIENKEIQCRQLIWEYGTNEGPDWIHLGINHPYNNKKNNEVLYVK